MPRDKVVEDGDVQGAVESAPVAKAIDPGDARLEPR